MEQRETHGETIRSLKKRLEDYVKKVEEYEGKHQRPLFTYEDRTTEV